MKRVLLAVVLVVLLVSLFGCNTISGFGRDISGAAETVEGWITKP
ncbi:MAG: entericidin [Phycisphaerae bacterium]|nr:entericidin [Phycisphaerae bacterium]